MLSALLASAYALPAQDLAQNLPEAKRNNVLFTCYPTSKTLEEFNPCVEKGMTDAGFGLTLGLRGFYGASSKCFGQVGALKSLDDYKRCIGKEATSFQQHCIELFEQALLIKKETSSDQLPLALNRLYGNVKAELTNNFAFVLTENQLKHVNNCILLNIENPISTFANCINAIYSGSPLIISVTPLNQNKAL
jgi:hypothetical protein